MIFYTAAQVMMILMVVEMMIRLLVGRETTSLMVEMALTRQYTQALIVNIL